MWIGSTLGFYSVCEWEKKKWFRVRCEQDARNLIKAADMEPSRFVVTPDCDYGWRVRCDSLEEYERCLKAIGREVNYHKFKPAISNTPDQADKHDGYMNLWAWLAEHFGGGSYDWMHQKWKKRQRDANRIRTRRQSRSNAS
jgi:hypothetical protein